MRFRSPLTFLGILGIALMPAALRSQAPDPAIGTWKLNTAKSTFNPGPPQKSETRTYEMAGKTLKMTSTVVEADGTTSRVQSTYATDGKTYPVAGVPDVDSQSLKQIDRFTAEGTLMKNGKVVRTAKRTVSADGKTLTIWFKGTDAKGGKIDNMLVFDKQ